MGTLDLLLGMPVFTVSTMPWELFLTHPEPQSDPGYVLFTEDCDDDLSFAIVDQADRDGTLFNADDEIRVPVPSEPQATLPGRTAHRPKNVIWFRQLVRPSHAPEG